MRTEQNVTRGKPITIHVNGEAVASFAGETVATAMLERSTIFRRDMHGEPRGLFCNMGTCSECLVTLLPSGRRVRACLLPAVEGMEIETRG